MSGNLETCMVQICSTFQRYAGKDGDAKTLSKTELVELATKEFPALCSNQNKDEVLKGVFGQLDMDGDGKVDFKEFCIFICCLTMALKEHLKC
ncbi:protein S100-A4-like [Pelobates fuscus]|uniref:protein S100-A4-like n=1 Tax=Pelobates fuscus TaxID=191477 RepID=UPI002FE4B098